MRSEKSIGFLAVVAIGIGGMVGGGIFAVLGLAVQLSHGGTPVAFLVAGLIALITSYSYARLSVRYPSQGGTVNFLKQAFGTGLLTGGLNILLWVSYVVMLSLYSYAFGSYGSSLLPVALQPLGKHMCISGVIILFTFLNILGSSSVGKAEEWLVGIKITILLLFIAVGFWRVNYGQLAPSTWTPIPQLIAGGMIIFVAYEGFELIANTAKDVKNPASVLPRAYYTSVIFVILLYIFISVVVIGNLPVSKIIAARDYALAESARPFFGNPGFILIAIAALLSTGSAINATFYGSAKISYIIARDGELPKILEKKIWQRPIEGLLITCVFALFMANFFDLSSISVMGSAGFLLIFAFVNIANMRLSKQTKSLKWISTIGAFACFGALGTLLWERARVSPKELWILAIMIGLSFAIEAIYRKFTHRVISLKS